MKSETNNLNLLNLNFTVYIKMEKYLVNADDIIQNKTAVDTYICLNRNNQYVIQANMETIIKNPELQITQLKEKIKELKEEIIKLGGTIF